MARVATPKRTAEIKALLGMFVYERMVYLAVTLVSVTILLVCATKLMLSDNPDYPLLLGLFAPTGGIIYATGRLLRMWSDALRVLYPGSGKEPAAGEAETEGGSP